MIYSIQFLRFIASLMVVVSHTFNVLGMPKSISVGDAGVDIFFVISGFVIGTIGERNVDWKDFYLRRFIRIFPLYWIALTAFIAFKYLRWHLWPTTDDLLHSIFLIPKLEVGWGPILFPAWTLSYELFFYALFGLCLAVASRRILAICSLALLILALIPLPGMQDILAQSLLLEFMAGLWIARFYRGISALGYRAGIMFTAIAVVGFIVMRSNAGYRALNWGLPSMALVAGMICFERAALFRSKFVTLLGAASYSTYLSHLIVMSVLHDAAWIYFDVELRQYGLISNLCVALIAIGIGIAVHLYIEQPLLAYLKKKLLPDRHRPQTVATA